MHTQHLSSPSLPLSVVRMNMVAICVISHCVETGKEWSMHAIDLQLCNGKNKTNHNDDEQENIKMKE